MRHVIIAFTIVGLLLAPGVAAGQGEDRAGEVGGHVAVAASGELDTSIGVGVRAAWRPSWLGTEAELTIYPQDRPENGAAFTSGSIEGLFGVTAGPVLGRVRPFARVRPGFLRVQEAPQPIVCILIFPPPLGCTLAGGRTLFALDLGGGVELFPTGRTVIRIDVGDRLVRYPGPAFDRDREVHDSDFFAHELRFAAGAGLRF